MAEVTDVVLGDWGAGAGGAGGGADAAPWTEADAAAAVERAPSLASVPLTVFAPPVCTCSCIRDCGVCVCVCVCVCVRVERAREHVGLCSRRGAHPLTGNTPHGTARLRGRVVGFKC